MKDAVRQWLIDHADDLVQCRIATIMSRKACRTWQGTYQRHLMINLDGHYDTVRNRNQIMTIAAEYRPCFSPTPCPHLLSDKEAEKIWRRLMRKRAIREQLRRGFVSRAMRFSWLTAPLVMEPQGAMGIYEEE